MKISNIKYLANAILGGKVKATRTFCSDAAKDNWCNRQYRRFGEEVTVEVYRYSDFDKDFDDFMANPPRAIETWHA